MVRGGVFSIKRLVFFEKAFVFAMGYVMFFANVFFSRGFLFFSQTVLFVFCNVFLHCFFLQLFFARVSFFCKFFFPQGFLLHCFFCATLCFFRSGSDLASKGFSEGLDMV